MSRMCTLHELALTYARKQPGMINSIVEDSPIINVCKWKPSTHDYWNVAEKITNIQGPGWVKSDAILPEIKVATDLARTDLYVTGGEMEVPTQHALMMGGHVKYFGDRQDSILKRAGMDLERKFVEDIWLEAAIQSGNVQDAGGSADGWYLLAIRFDEDSNVGLYNPKQFKDGTFYEITVPHGGNEHRLYHKEHEGVWGYTIIYRAVIGWQLLVAEKTCAAIVNIDEGHKPTVEQIDMMLADVRAVPGKTYIFCSPRAKILGLNKHKRDNIQIVNSDKDMNTYIEAWNGIQIVPSYNIADKIRHINV